MDTCSHFGQNLNKFVTEKVMTQNLSVIQSLLRNGVFWCLMMGKSAQGMALNKEAAVLAANISCLSAGLLSPKRNEVLMQHSSCHAAGESVSETPGHLTAFGASGCCWLHVSLRTGDQH